MSLSTEDESNGIKIAGLIELISAHELELTAHTQELEALASKMSDQIELAAGVSRLRHRDHLSVMGDLKELEKRVEIHWGDQIAQSGNLWKRARALEAEVIKCEETEKMPLKILTEFVRLYRAGRSPAIAQWEQAEKVVSS